MAIAIEFLGICFFDYCTRRRDVRVLLPNAVNAAGRKHLDGKGRKKAKPHYAWFFAFDAAGRRLVARRLNGETVSFRGVAGPRPVKPQADAVADVSAFTQGLTLKADAKLANPDLVAARILLPGGTLQPTGSTPFGPFDIDDTLKSGHSYRPRLAPALTWSVDAAELEMDIEADGTLVETILLQDVPGVRYGIGNVDVKLPTAWPVTRVDCAEGKVIVDEDFKWHYHLFEPPARTWAAALKGRPLPVPTVRCPARPAVRAAGAPTCNCMMC